MKKHSAVSMLLLLLLRSLWRTLLGREVVVGVVFLCLSFLYKVSLWVFYLFPSLFFFSYLCATERERERNSGLVYYFCSSMRTRRGLCYPRVGGVCNSDNTAVMKRKDFAGQRLVCRKRIKKSPEISASGGLDFFDGLPDDLVISILCKLSSSSTCPLDFLNVLITYVRVLFASSLGFSFVIVIIRRKISKTIPIFFFFAID